MKAGWHIKALEDIAYLAGRIGWKGLTAKEYTEEGPFFLSVHSLNYGDYVDFRDAFHISQHRYDESPEIMLQADDVLICKDGAGIGKVGIIGEMPGPATINSSLLLIRALGQIDAKFLYYALSSPYFQRIVQQKIDGATTPHLYQKDIRAFPVPVPPLPEQPRIVSILDEAFVGLEAMRANAEKNLQNARSLFGTMLADLFTKDNSNWTKKPIAQIATKIGSGATPKGGKQSYKAQGLSLIRSMNVHDRRFKYDDLAYLDDEQAEKLSNVVVEKDDVLLNITGASVARCCKVPENVLPARVNQHVSIIRPVQTSILPRFLEYALTARPNKERLLGVGEKGGSTRQAITKAQIEEFPIAFPAVELQARLIADLDGMADETSRLEAIYTKKLAAIDELKQSILQKAFAGELTAAEAVAA